jgi:hypothetical protein
LNRGTSYIESGPAAFDYEEKIVNIPPGSFTHQPANEKNTPDVTRTSKIARTPKIARDSVLKKRK